MKDDADTSDSDNSLDLEPIQHPLTSPLVNSNEEYGIGASLLAQMGYTPGQGLGAQQQGIVEPIDQVKRPGKSGLGKNFSEIHSQKKSDKTTANQVLNVQDPTSDQVRKENAILLLESKKQGLLKIREALESKTMDNLAGFIRSFRSSPYWFTLKLWEAVLVWAYERYKDIACLDFVQHMDELLSIADSIPTSHWTGFLKQIWVPKFAELLRENAEANECSDSFDVVIALDLLQWFETLPGLDRKIDFAEFPHILRLLSNPQNAGAIIVHGKIDVVTSMFHQFPKLLKLSAHKLNANEQKILSQYGRVDTLLTALQPCDLSTSFDLVIKAHIDSALDDSELQIVMQCLWSKWLGELQSLVLGENLTVDWWNLWRDRLTRYSIAGVQSETWLLRGLNLINTVFDTHEAPQSELAESWDLSLGEVLERYCCNRNLRCRFETSSKGTISNEENTVAWEIKDDVLYLTENRLPVSFNGIKNFI